MRPGGINIGVPAAVRAMRDRVEGRGAKAAPRFVDAAGKVIRRPGIQGFACLHGKAFHASGRFRVIESGAFISTIHDGKPKRLLFNHDDIQELGSTDTGLEFANCLTGLAFRMPLDGNVNAQKIYDAVTRNERPCVSIGAEVSEKTVKTADGIEYDLCAKVTVNEISLCEEGAVSGTYAKIVDLDDEEPMLWLACRSSTFASDKIVANCQATIKRILDKLQKLKE